MITHDRPHHNGPAARRFRFRWSVLIILLLAVTACSEDRSTKEEPPSEAAKLVTDCGLTYDTSAWTAFKEVADRIGAGQDVTKEELDTFGDLPTVTIWRKSQLNDHLTAHRMGNWLEGLYWEELGHKGEQKQDPNKNDFIRSYRYSIDSRDRIDKRLTELTGPGKCGMADIARFWIEPDLLPKTLNIHFLPMKTEILLYEDNLLVDTGLVGAGRAEQLIRQMAALLYKTYQFVPGPNPTDQIGAEAVAQSFRVLMNEGIKTWIEQTVDIDFDSKHPVLDDFRVVPEDFFAKTQKMIGHMNLRLGSFLDDEDMMIKEGQPLASRLAVSGAFSEASYGMAAVISARLGEDRLRDVGRSVPAFLAAYQEAATANPVPVPVPGDIGVELYQTVPPLDPEVFTKLHALLTEVFPD